VDEFPDRPYDIFIPENLDSKTKVPVLMLLHDQDTDALNALIMTCNNGHINDPSCISELANKEGFVVMIPRGTPRILANWQRSWNAGGGDVKQQWECNSGNPCKQQVNDVEYIDKVLQHVQTKVLIDHHRIYATGLGNGAAMSHRLACQLPNRIAAIAAISGSNQASQVQECRPVRAIPVLQIHGTEDCYWPFLGGARTCGKPKNASGHLLSFAQSMQTWAKINGCDEQAITTELDNDPSISRMNWQACQQPLIAYRIENGGHYWPNGFQPKAFAPKQAPKAIMNRNVSNKDIWDFLSAHRNSIE
jgi:polyhydroxybutyrate depolymerase